MLIEELKENAEDYKIYVDLDGVMADFVGGVRKLLNGDYSEEQYEADSKYRNKMWKALGEYQKQGGEFFYELGPMADASTLWSYVARYNPEVLTAAGNPEYNADQQKRRWVSENIGPNVKVNVTRKSRDKAQYADKNHILIDDKEKSINPWIAAGGIGILHTSAEDTIAQLKKLGI